MARTFIAAQMIQGMTCSYEHEHGLCGRKHGQRERGQMITLALPVYKGEIKGVRSPMFKGPICNECQRLVRGPEQYAFLPIEEIATLLERHSFVAREEAPRARAPKPARQQPAPAKGAAVAPKPEVEIPDYFARDHLFLLNEPYNLDIAVWNAARRKAYTTVPKPKFLDVLSEFAAGQAVVKHWQAKKAARAGKQDKGPDANASPAPVAGKQDGQRFGSQLAEALAKAEGLTTDRTPTPAS